MKKHDFEYFWTFWRKNENFNFFEKKKKMASKKIFSRILGVLPKNAKLFLYFVEKRKKATRFIFFQKCKWL